MTDRDLVRAIVDCFEGHAYTNHPADAGGPTKFGVTQKLLASFLGRHVTADEVRHMGIDLAVDVLHSEFCFKPKLYEITNPLVKLCAVDFSVNSGAARGVRSLQYAVFQKPPYDGVFGPLTKSAVNRAAPDQVRRDMLAYRIKFIGRLITRKPSQAVFAEGWMKRIAALQELEPGQNVLTDLRELLNRAA